MNGVAAACRMRVKPAVGEDLPQPGLAGLGAEPEPDVLGERGGGAEQGGEPVEGAADRVEVVLGAVACVGLDDQPGAVGGQGAAGRGGPRRRGRPCRAGVEEGDQVVAGAGVVGGRGDLEADPVGDAGVGGALCGRRRSTRRGSRSRRTRDAGRPGPAGSSTRRARSRRRRPWRPALSLSSTPSSAGSQLATGWPGSRGGRTARCRGRVVRRVRASPRRRRCGTPR